MTQAKRQLLFPGQGWFRTHIVRDKIWSPPLHIWTPNTWLYGWGHIAAQTLVRGNAAYKLAAMYIEFENVADPSDAVSIPTIAREEGISYYNGLSTSPNRDFLRIAIETAPELSVVSGYDSLLEPGYVNRAVLSAQTAGAVGVYGKTFSNGANSKIFGIAVVATPDFDDQTQDVIFARAYHATGDQTIKPASAQVAVTYRLDFT